MVLLRFMSQVQSHDYVAIANHIEQPLDAVCVCGVGAKTAYNIAHTMLPQ